MVELVVQQRRGKVISIMQNHTNANWRYLDYEAWQITSAMNTCESEGIYRSETGKEGPAQAAPEALSISSTARWSSATSSFGMGYVCSGAG